MVISCSRRRGGVAEESIVEFSQGSPITPVDYPGTLPPFQVLWQARNLLGTRWDLFRFNCEHFVRLAHGLEPQSPQLQSGVALAALLGFVSLVSLGSRAS
jgi:hypothetical protein